MAGPLLSAGLVLASIVGVSAVVHPQRGRTGPMDRRLPGIAILLLVPVILMALDPKPLGPNAIGFRSVSSTGPISGGIVPPLPPAVAGSVPLTEGDFILRALFSGPAFARVRVRLVGFVVVDPAGGGFLLTRFAISCCAADAIPVQVAVRVAPNRVPPPDTWVEAEGTWVPPAPGARGHLPPMLRASHVRTIEQPRDPYE
jgi:putative membrane protein